MVSIREQSPQDSGTFAADADAIGQIVLNLVDNACKYGQSGTEPAAVDVELRRAGARLLITVGDHGPGIDASLARRIFEPFDRGGIEPGAAIPGVGLGLALSRELALALGGRLTLEPTSAGHGARFLLSVPVVG